VGLAQFFTIVGTNFLMENLILSPLGAGELLGLQVKILEIMVSTVLLVLILLPHFCPKVEVAAQDLVLALQQTMLERQDHQEGVGRHVQLLLLLVNAQEGLLSIQIRCLLFLVIQWEILAVQVLVLPQTQISQLLVEVVLELQAQMLPRIRQAQAVMEFIRFPGLVLI